MVDDYVLAASPGPESDFKSQKSAASIAHRRLKVVAFPDLSYLGSTSLGDHDMGVEAQYRSPRSLRSWAGKKDEGHSGPHERWSAIGIDRERERERKRQR